MSEVLLGSIAEIRVKSEDEELVQLTYKLVNEKLKTIEELRELKQYFDLEDLDEDIEDTETDMIKQLLQSDLIDYRTKINDRVIAQLKDYFKSIAIRSLSQNDNMDRHRLEIILSLTEKCYSAELQYYALYYYRWNILLGGDKNKKEAVKGVEILEKIGVVKPKSLVSEQKKRKTEKKRKQLAKQILQLYEEGYSIREIAKMLKLSKNTVHKYIKQYAKL